MRILIALLCAASIIGAAQPCLAEETPDIATVGKGLLDAPEPPKPTTTLSPAPDPLTPAEKPKAQPLFGRGDLVRVADGHPCLRVIGVPGDTYVELLANGTVQTAVRSGDPDAGAALAQFVGDVRLAEIKRPASRSAADHDAILNGPRPLPTPLVSASYLTILRDGTSFVVRDIAPPTGSENGRRPASIASRLYAFPGLAGGPSTLVASEFKGGASKMILLPQDWMDPVAVEDALELRINRLPLQGGFEQLTPAAKFREHDPASLKLCSRYDAAGERKRALDALGAMPAGSLYFLDIGRLKASLRS